MAGAKKKTAEKFDTAKWHRGLITAQRFKVHGSSLKGRTIDEEAASDRARVIYSSAFRRLQHKTQVFTLSDSTTNDAASLKKWGEEIWEWFCRAHLIIDYLSGMTDDFAYRTYQVISGAQLE